MENLIKLNGKHWPWQTTLIVLMLFSKNEKFCFIKNISLDNRLKGIKMTLLKSEMNLFTIIF